MCRRVRFQSQLFLTLTQTQPHTITQQWRGIQYLAPKSPWTHMCNTLCLLTTKPKTLKKNKCAPSSGNRRPGRGISPHHFYLQLESTWVDAPVRAEPGNQGEQVHVQICPPHPSPPSPPAFITGRQRDGISNVLLETVRLPEDRDSVTLGCRTQLGT